MIRFLSPRHLLAFAAALILAAGLWVRAWAIGAEPMWLDEGYSAYAASKGWYFLWHVVPRYETHPPFYYSTLRAWTLIAGDGLVAHRMLGLVCGLATLPLIALVARRLAALAGVPRGRVMLAALAMAAASPMMVEMTREVRPYPVMILVYTLAMLALMAIAARRAAGLPLAGRAFAAYLACTALMLWLHNLGPFYAGALGLALLCVARVRRMARADWLWLAGGGFLVLAIWLPALFILMDQAPEWVKATWLHFSTVDLPRRATVMFAGTTDDQRIAAAILTLLGAALPWRARDGRRLLAALLILALLPLALSLIISATVAPIFIIRTMTPLAVPAILLMAMAAGWRWKPGLLVALGALAWLCASQFALDIRLREHPRRDWYRTMAWLAPRFQIGDMVFAYPNEGALPFERAVRDKRLFMPTRPIPTAIPSLDAPPGSIYVSGSRGVPSLDRAHLRQIVDQPETQAIPTIWLLRLGPWAYDKGDAFLDELSRGRIEVGRYKDGPIDIVGLRKSSRFDTAVTPAKAGAPGE